MDSTSKGAHALARNNTNFPIKLKTKLSELYKKYIAAKNSEDDPEHKWANTLKYYQYLVRSVMSNPEFGIGVDGNARGILVYHTMGMGKTRLAVAVAMSMWDVRPVVVMLARSLQENFRKTVFDVIDIIHADKSSEVIEKLRAEAMAKTTFVSMDAYNAADQMVRAGKKKSSIAMGGLDNKLLIVDEAHNFFRAIINSADEKSNARRIYDLAMNANNLRIVFLTGTPASKDPFELVPCFNMLAGFDLLPPHYEIFYQLYVDTKNHEIRNRERLANRLMGLVSHVEPNLPSEPDGHKQTIKAVRDDGWFPEELPVIVERVEMSAWQYKQYLHAREKEDVESKTSDGYTNANKVISTPALALPGSERKSMKSYYVNSRTLSTFCPPRDWLSASIDVMPDEIFTADVGPKLEIIAERVKLAPGPVLIYSQFVDAGGLKAAARFLQRRGFKQYSPITNAGSDSYAIISGEVANEVRNEIKDKFNSFENAHGEIIKCILVSKTGAEGLDLKWLRETHQIEPYWDKSRDHQVIARAVRLGSHDGLPREERVVQPYLYIGTANQQIYQQMDPKMRELHTVDEMFFIRATERAKTNMAFRKLLLEICFECELFKYGSCRMCVPTNEPLFHKDPALDVRLPDPCEPQSEKDIEATPIEFEGITYYYVVDSSDPLGYKFYVFREDLGGYAQLQPSDPVAHALLQLLL